MIQQNTSKSNLRSNQPEKTLILFEPWSLGDALIAAAAISAKPINKLLVCQQKWHALILTVFPEIKPEQLISASVSYASRKGHAKENQAPLLSEGVNAEVLSIRGDFRDYFSAKKFFPGSPIVMTGWFSFFARRISILDWFVRTGLVSVRNRYRAWCELVGIEYQTLKSIYELKNQSHQKSVQPKKIVIHCGAQWKSKQFPNVSELKKSLVSNGYSVKLIAGVGDFIPEGIESHEINFLMGIELIQELKTCEVMICNDSGPMHLAAGLGVSVLTLARTSNIFEWLPPGVNALVSRKMPTGYGAVSGYQSDRVLGEWPTLAEVVGKTEALHASIINKP